MPTPRTGPRPFTILLVLLFCWLLLQLLPSASAAAPPADSTDTISHEIPVPVSPDLHAAQGTGPAALGVPVLLEYRPIGDSAAQAVGITGWVCSRPRPFTLYEEGVIEQWQLLVVTRVHERTHREQYGRFPSCAAANAALRSSLELRTQNEAEAFCREIPAGVAVGYYPGIDEGVRRAALLLAIGYPFGLTPLEAAQRIRAACSLPAAP